MHDVVDLRCDYSTHGKLYDGRFLSIRCTDRRCPDALWAKDTGQRCYHVWDLRAVEDGRPKMRTMFEVNPDADRKAS